MRRYKWCTIDAQVNPHFFAPKFHEIKISNNQYWKSQGPVAQLVASTNAADPGFLSSIPARPHTFLEIDSEIFSMVILLLSLIARLTDWPSQHDHSYEGHPINRENFISM